MTQTSSYILTCIIILKDFQTTRKHIYSLCEPLSFWSLLLCGRNHWHCQLLVGQKTDIRRLKLTYAAAQLSRALEPKSSEIDQTFKRGMDKFGGHRRETDTIEVKRGMVKTGGHRRETGAVEDWIDTRGMEKGYGHRWFLHKMPATTELDTGGSLDMIIARMRVVITAVSISR